ncbi:MAG: hypothetical protein IGQ88_11625 [Gloeomargaritaceae cyanobacterium C42_A2020_066]|nr:hypothetical protein [Gloeomargaritaceae cyanobacterium C42_A2020_066]
MTSTLELYAEICTLRQQLNQRNRLVDQLSKELYHSLHSGVGEVQDAEVLTAVALPAAVQAGGSAPPTPAESSALPDGAALARLKTQLQQRDVLVHQLSQELFHCLRSPLVPETVSAEMQTLRDQVATLQGNLEVYQVQLATREAEALQLRQNLETVTERSRWLEDIVKELPEVYRRRFEARLAPIKEQIATLQQENRRLRAELQRVSALVGDGLSRPADRVELPQLSSLKPLRTPEMINLSHA